MGLLFLDPLVLLATAVTLVGCWVVWRGSLRSWFGRPGVWTALIWPLPGVLVALPFVVGPVRSALALALDVTGLTLSETADAFVFATLYLVPLVGLTVWPPRWLLPGWARARLAAPVRTSSGVGGRDDGPDEVAIPACLGRRGHGSRARWVWQVDAVVGVLTVTDGQLGFRPDPPVGTTLPTDDLPNVPERRGAPAASPAGEPDREQRGTRTGATWGRRYLEADLAAVDRVRLQARRPWASDGLLTLELDGRSPAHVWVTDVRRLQSALGPFPE